MCANAVKDVDGKDAVKDTDQRRMNASWDMQLEGVYIRRLLQVVETIVYNTRCSRALSDHGGTRLGRRPRREFCANSPA